MHSREKIKSYMGLFRGIELEEVDSVGTVTCLHLVKNIHLSCSVFGRVLWYEANLVFSPVWSPGTLFLG